MEENVKPRNKFYYMTCTYFIVDKYDNSHNWRKDSSLSL